MSEEKSKASFKDRMKNKPKHQVASLDPKDSPLIDRQTNIKKCRLRLWQNTLG